MAQNGAIFVFCSSCKILYIESSVHPRIATDFFNCVSVLKNKNGVHNNLCTMLFWDTLG